MSADCPILDKITQLQDAASRNKKNSKTNGCLAANNMLIIKTYCGQESSKPNIIIPFCILYIYWLNTLLFQRESFSHMP